MKWEIESGGGVRITSGQDVWMSRFNLQFLNQKFHPAQVQALLQDAIKMAYLHHTMSFQISIV